MKNETTDKATARQWFIGGYVKQDDGVEFIGIGDGAMHIAKASITGCVSRQEAEEHATLIVRAVNEHAALVAVAEAANLQREAIRTCKNKSSATHNLDTALANLAAIQKSGGGE